MFPPVLLLLLHRSYHRNCLLLFKCRSPCPSIHPWVIIVSQQREDKRSLINGTRTSSGNRRDPKEQQRNQPLAPHRTQLTPLTSVAATITALAITRGHMWASSRPLWNTQQQRATHRHGILSPALSIESSSAVARECKEGYNCNSGWEESLMRSQK